MSTQAQLHFSRRSQIKRGFVLSVITTLVFERHLDEELAGHRAAADEVKFFRLGHLRSAREFCFKPASLFKEVFDICHFLSPALGTRRRQAPLEFEQLILDPQF